MYKQLLFLILIFPLLLTSCADDDGDGCIMISGPVINESRTVSEFHSVSLEGVGSILLTQGTPQSLTIETHQSVLNSLKTEVNNEKLNIELDDCISGNLDKLDIHITIPNIEKLELSGVGNIFGQNNFDLTN